MTFTTRYNFANVTQSVNIIKHIYNIIMYTIRRQAGRSRSALNSRLIKVYRYFVASKHACGGAAAAADTTFSKEFLNGRTIYAVRILLKIFNRTVIIYDSLKIKNKNFTGKIDDAVSSGQRGSVLLWFRHRQISSRTGFNIFS